MIDYSKLPDLVAIALLTCAFASVARKARAAGAAMWLSGWLLIGLHFLAFMFLAAPGAWGQCAAFIGIASLTWAAVLFIRASLPYRDNPSAFWMSMALIASNSVYLAALIFLPEHSPWLVIAAMFFGFAPLGTAVVAIPDFQHPLRWAMVGIQCTLAVLLAIVPYHGSHGGTVALNAILFTSYITCSLYFWQSSKTMTTGSFIATSGFFAWAMVFVVAPLMQAFASSVPVENEVWNLPKYVVATGMILMILERQIEHNKFLALHDELTGLPNRRLFQDRLRLTLERTRRTGTATALLLIDLDCFKQVNDSLGHHVGDGLLCSVGDLFTNRLRRSDTVARTGGDEFSVILEEPITRKDAERVARQLAELMENPIAVGEHSIRVGASIGIALFPEDGVTPEALCIAADLRMYDAKNGGRSEAMHNGVPLPRPALPEPAAARSA